MTVLEENYRRILDRIGAAAHRSGRLPGDVRLLGVSKRVGVERIREVVELGLGDIAENRVQEAEEKIPALRDLPVRCHFIGHLQSNKARRALTLFDSIQSLDTVDLARRLDGMLENRFPVFVQVRSGEEATKSGVSEQDLPDLVAAVRGSRWLDLEGLMTIPPYREDPDDARVWFARLRELGERYDLHRFSMGMSHDFEVAIEEGATEIRVGTALFGERR